MKTSPEKLAYIKEWRKNNPDKVKAYSKKYTEKNKDKINAYVKQWAKDNKGKVCARTRKYQAAKLQRTVAWNDDLVMQMIYEDCPEGYQVDHIVPLQGEYVSGLHVHYNLQYLTAAENRQKSNNHEI